MTPIAQHEDKFKTNNSKVFYQQPDKTSSDMKFTPPYINNGSHMFFRHQTISRLIISTPQYSNHIFIHAQAGQGKSILAVQFLTHIGANYAWIRIDKRDKDPIILSSAIATSLLKDFPSLKTSKIYEAISSNKLNHWKSEHLADMLLDVIIQHIKKDYFLVLDDLHLINNATNSINLLQILASQISNGLTLIFLSRSPIIGLSDKCRCLDNNALALRCDKITDFFDKVFKISIPPAIIQALHHATEGWIMGLFMAKEVMLTNSHIDPNKLPFFLINSNPNLFQTYFEKEVFSSICENSRQILLSLALLESIPLDMVETLTLSKNIFTYLEYFLYNNLFIHKQGGSSPTYSFQPLFKLFLEQKASRQLSTKHQRKILVKAGHWYLKQESRQSKKIAMYYYLKAKSYGMVDKIVSQLNLKFITSPFPLQLIDSINKISHTAVESYAYLSLFIAKIHLHSNPLKSQSYLEQSIRKYVEDANAIGELQATTMLIIYHVGFKGDFKHGRALLRRAETLYKRLKNQLSTATYIQSVTAIAYGLCHFTGQRQKAAAYITPLFKFIEEKQLDDAKAQVSVALGLIDIMEANWTEAKQHMEKIFSLLTNPVVTKLNKHFIFTQQLALLEMQGDFIVYEYYRKKINAFCDPNLIVKSISGSRLMICDINYALTKGSVDHAIHLARQGLKTKFPGGLIPHLQSLLLGYLAYCLALSGKKDEALAAADKSAYLRKQAGGTYYQMVTKMILGAVYTQLNLAQKAESTLSEAIKESKNLSEMFVRVSAYAHRAILRLNHHRINDAIADVRSCLTGMKNRNYIHFHTWHPALMQKILTTAITNNIEIDYSQKLANKRLTISITPAGEAFPILKIITLGRFELKLKDKVIANYKNFSTIQRELLALLVSSPKTGLSLETIQVIFWPESLPQKVRSKLDNLLARLRKVLNSLLTPYPASLYISTEKGFLRLHNCCVDVEYFMQEVQNGLSHLYRKNSCQANTAFLKAHYWYKGNFMPRVNLKKHAYAFHEKLQHFYLKSTYHWAEILSKTQRYKKAIAICQKALTCDPTHQPLVKFLYHLYTQYLNSDKASEIINNYKKALICEGFSQTEIDVIMNNFWRH